MKKKTKLISFLLILTLSFCCIIAPYYGQQIYSKALENEANDEFEELLDSYLTANGISDDYIYEQEEEITEQYIQYVHFDNSSARYRKLVIENTPIDEKYGKIIYEEEIDISEQIPGEDAYDVAIVRMIHKNVDLMNTLVDTYVGHINDDYEFVFDVSDESYSRLRCYDFRLKWNGLSFNGDSDAAILFAGITLVWRFIFNGRKGGFQNAIQAIQNKSGDLERAITETLDSLPNDIISQMISFFTNDVISNLIETCSFLIDIFSKGSILATAIKIVLDHFTPSLLDGIIVLYRAIVGYGIEVKLCWIWTFHDKFGLSIKSV